MESQFEILVVDDDENLASNLRDILQGEGYGTALVQDGQTALALCRKKVFDLAIIDIRLPDMSGIELLEPLKEMHPDMVVIMVTGYAALETAVRALNEGASAYITKPLNMEEVLIRVREVLERQHLIKENRRLYEEAQRELAERRRAEKKAQEAETLKEFDRLRTELLANISHELRTPLASIKGFVSTLLRTDTKWSEEEQRDFLHTADQEADRLAHLINDLLDMSRLDVRALKLKKRNHHISEILDSVSDRLARLTEGHKLKVAASLELPIVYVDEIRIGQVLTNLVENAAKYSSEGSEIVVDAQLNGNKVIIEVTDKGEGIPAEFLPKVFDRFYQSDRIASGQKSGTGLGLSICQGIIEAHDGRIWVESKLGAGSRFSFSLPLSTGEEKDD